MRIPGCIRTGCTSLTSSSQIATLRPRPGNVSGSASMCCTWLLVSAYLGLAVRR